MSNHSTRKPYVFQEHYTRIYYCGKCGHRLKNGDIVIWRTSHDIHLGYKERSHVTHVRHMVDAHGEPLYE